MSILRTIIVEDEAGAASHLTSILRAVEPDINICGILHSIAEAIEWITSNHPPDLAFFDIQLEDGLSFEIFKKVEVSFPVIFTTAYDQYAIDAFKVNSIDYLLKPIKESDLLFSIRKYKNVSSPRIDGHVIEQLINRIDVSPRSFTLLIRSKDKLIPVREDDFAYFWLENGILRGRTFQNQVFPIDHTIDDLMLALNKQTFFRANRQVVINRNGIQEAEQYFNGRLAINVIHGPKDLILISKARVSIFKEWWTGLRKPH